MLVLLTDMTNFADALKEIAITMEQIPSNRGYPGDLYTQLAARYEKAVDFEGAGSITILAVTTMPGDDVTHPVPDNTGYITEGQFYLRGRAHRALRLPVAAQAAGQRQDPRRPPRAHGRHDPALRRLPGDAGEERRWASACRDWDRKLLKYGELFEKQIMDLSVNIPLEQALDLGWEILADCFTPEETGMRTELIEQFWPGEEGAGSGLTMAKIKLTKNELKKQKDALKRFKRYLPTLMLKKQQLQLEIRRVEAEQRQKVAEREAVRAGLLSWVEVFGEEAELEDLIRVAAVHTADGNIAGVDIPDLYGDRRRGDPLRPVHAAALGRPRPGPQPRAGHPRRPRCGCSTSRSAGWPTSCASPPSGSTCSRRSRSRRRGPTSG